MADAAGHEEMVTTQQLRSRVRGTRGSKYSASTGSVCGLRERIRCNHKNDGSRQSWAKEKLSAATQRVVLPTPSEFLMRLRLTFLYHQPLWRLSSPSLVSCMGIRSSFAIELRKGVPSIKLGGERLRSFCNPNRLSGESSGNDETLHKTYSRNGQAAKWKTGGCVRVALHRW